MSRLPPVAPSSTPVLVMEPERYRLPLRACTTPSLLRVTLTVLPPPPPVLLSVPWLTNTRLPTGWLPVPVLLPMFWLSLVKVAPAWLTRVAAPPLASPPTGVPALSSTVPVLDQSSPPPRKTFSSIAVVPVVAKVPGPSMSPVP